MTAATSPAGNGSQLELAQARSGLYGLLARVFGAPLPVELLKGIKDRQMLASLAAFDVSFDHAFLGASEEAQAADLAGEYARLFLGPGDHIAPFESVFVQRANEIEPRLWGQATVEVANFYRQAGLCFSSRRVPDHVGLEFEAMALLAQAEAEKCASGDTAEAERLLGWQRRFCQEHLLHWVPELCRLVEQETQSDFYRKMAVLAHGLVTLSCGQDAIF